MDSNRNGHHDRRTAPSDQLVDDEIRVGLNGMSLCTCTVLFRSRRSSRDAARHLSDTAFARFSKWAGAVYWEVRATKDIPTHAVAQSNGGGGFAEF